MRGLQPDLTPGEGPLDDSGLFKSRVAQWPHPFPGDFPRDHLAHGT